jgi:hypothetical protein
VQVQQVADRFLEQWMNSPGHRSNILSANYSHMASGCFHVQDAAGQRQRRCTQLFARAYAVAEQDIPETVTAGQRIAVRIHALQGFTMPTQLIQLNLSNGAEPNSAPLTPSSDVAVGNIMFSGPAGVYSLQLHVPNQDSAGHYWIVPGPYVTVQ